MVGMKCNLKQTLEIAETTTDPKVKLQARAIANDCYKFIMEMSTNAGIVSDALKFVTRQQEQIQKIETTKLLDKRIEVGEEEETTEAVF